MSAFEIHIVPYQEQYQAGVNSLMTMIAKEFPTPIAPQSSIPGMGSSSLPGVYWVALVNDNVAGTIAIYKLKNDAVVLRRMFLSSDFRGQGIAISLLNTAIDWAIDHTANTIYLGTMSQFKAAQRFYEKNGFEKVLPADLPPDFPVNPVDDLFYKKDLK